MTRYAKALLALIPVVVAGLNVIYDALNDHAVSTQEWVAVAIAALTAALVYQVPNTPPGGIADPRMSEQDPQRGSIPLEPLVVGAASIALFILVATVL